RSGSVQQVADELLEGASAEGETVEALLPRHGSPNRSGGASDAASQLLERHVLRDQRRQRDPLLLPQAEARDHAGTEQGGLAAARRACHEEESLAALGGRRAQPLEHTANLVLASIEDTGALLVEGREPRVGRQLLVPAQGVERIDVETLQGICQ